MRPFDFSLVGLFSESFALDQKSLVAALDQSIAYLKTQPREVELNVCGRQSTVGHQVDSLDFFRSQLMSSGPQNIDTILRNSFEICEVLNSHGNPELLATGYFQPRLQASKTPKGPYKYPLYSRPKELITEEHLDNGEVLTRIGRVESGAVVPFWTRSEIENGNKLKGQEILYLTDPVDAFILHVQGSGLAELPDGSIYQVLFDGSNGREYKSIGKLLVEEGQMALEDVSLPSIKRYLQEHLDDRQRILHYNDRYIFFRMALAEGTTNPVGSMGKVLTPQRSIALDNDCFPIGGLYFLESMAPEIDSTGHAIGWKPYSRFVLHQDTGAAIKGSGRLDFFWGSSEYARAAAGVMKQPARLYMIVGKL